MPNKLNTMVDRFFKSKTNFKLLSVILINLFATVLHSQISNKYYFPVAIAIGSDLMSSSNQPNAADYKIKNTISYDFGINWRVWNGNQFVLDAGLLVRSHAIKNSFHLGVEDLPEELGSYGEIVSVSPFKQYKVPITFSYKFLNNSRTTLLVGLGPQIVLVPDNLLGGTFSISTSDSKISYGYIEEGKSANGIQTGVLFNVELDIKTKYFAICPNLKYYYAPDDIYKITVTTQNLVSGNTATQHSVKNGYFGFGLSIYLAKSLFKKSKK